VSSVLTVLRHIADKGGIWTYKKQDDVWFIDPRYVQTDSGVAIGATKDELLEFLRHYEALKNGEQNDDS
jgi:hypothetical protein